LVEHARPAVHETQLCDWLQTRLVPQLVPAAFAVPSAQVCVPVEHEVVPLKQTFGFPLHAMPAVHDTQLPDELQTRSVPQPVPVAFAVPLMQVCAPVEHEVVPL
jgi:hypothetical protein